MFKVEKNGWDMIVIDPWRFDAIRASNTATARVVKYQAVQAELEEDRGCLTFPS